MNKRWITILVLLLLPLLSRAQLAISFLPETQGRTLEGLMMARIMNPGTQQLSCFLVIKVTEGRSGKIAETRTAAFSVLPGLSSIPPAIAYNASWQFGASPTATVIRQSHHFPEGEYEYCYELYANDKDKPGELLAEQCFDYFLEPFSPLMLTEPYDGDQICDKRPTLFWQPMLPAIPGMMYRLVLVEVKQGQAKAEALHYNMPIIQQLNIQTPMLFYPPISRELEEGKRYAWQVLANRGDMVLGRSEIWDFTVKCVDSTKALPVESYRNIEDLAKGNFYIAKERIFFAVNNTYDKATLKYDIQCINKPEIKIKKLPEIMLKRGRNEVIIDLEDVDGFTDGYFYLLNMRLPNGEARQLRFVYKAETE
ncbi:DUF928 domain-containing protein [Chitinophaga sp. SYP-B3965]|uniref:DUF928 domain-containing protein n=1 Tax=Chitinophaga sp. SYP-B3965 TaxID=2663120 RepID=UPI001299B47D|nr:DUF928 domain-containing protein [Chitinophaga sp. SYP-B3965]MRG44751.1 DUF928 domain-containing protein [Chitinophaga sp. SYP-B3965]